MMWGYRVHSSKTSRDCGATLKHPGLFECEDNSLKHQNYTSSNTVFHPSILLHDLQQNYFVVVTYTQEELIQQKHGSLGPRDAFFCNRKGSMTELQIAQTS
jgi:hypothetical protein